MYGFEEIEKGTFSKVMFASNIARRQNLLITKEQCKIDIKHILFAKQEEISGISCKLLSNCVNCTRVNLFKNRMDKYLLKAGYVYEYI